MHYNALAAKGIANNIMQHKDHSVPAAFSEKGIGREGVTGVHSAGEV